MMRMICRKKLLIIFLAVILLVVSWKSFFISGDTFPYDNMAKADCTVYYLDRPLSMSLPPYYVTGRIFLPLEDFVCAAGGTFTEYEDFYSISLDGIEIDIATEDDETLAYPLNYETEAAYISLYDVTNLFSLAAVFSFEENKVCLYKRSMPVVQQGATGGKKAAYIRLEDVSADGQVNPNAHRNYEKLRVMADYLYKAGHKFYVAWIPLYTNPKLNVQNDLTANFTLYNADFLFTLDYITQRGGNIALHGYTHQYGEGISGEGNEFGPDAPFTPSQVEDRFRDAVDYAKRLGFESRIFVFPHYLFTVQQQKIAEKYFDVIYQQSFYRHCLGQIDTVLKFGRTVRYVPTPIGYVSSLKEIKTTLDKMDALPPDQIMSMFVHPAVEYNSITCVTDASKRRVFVYNQNGVLPRIVRKLESMGYTFTTF